MMILIVEDSQELRLLLESRLKEAGYDVLSPESVADASALLGLNDEAAPPAKVDLILMDASLPNGAAVNLYQDLKNAERLPDLPVALLASPEEAKESYGIFAGPVDYISKPLRPWELLTRVRSLLAFKGRIDLLNRRVDDLQAATQHLDEVVKHLEKLSSVDGLTSLFNRRHFDECLDREWRRGRRNQSPLSLMMIDIDFFKRYNDSYGHQAGDECLKQVARAIKRSFQRAGDLAFRYGGEEFSALLPETTAEGAIQLAETLCRTVEALKIPHIKSQVSDHVTISLGVATAIPMTHSSPLTLMFEADMALYRAKSEGRNRACISPNLC